VIDIDFLDVQPCCSGSGLWAIGWKEEDSEIAGFFCLCFKDFFANRWESKKEAVEAMNLFVCWFYDTHKS
jgi:hypothetical protein